MNRARITLAAVTAVTLVIGLAALAGLTACGGGTFDKPMRLGDRVVQPETLNRGRDLFNRFCATCHGYDGKADTPQARQLDPHPRDFTAAQFKRVANPGALPTDAELSVIILNGIPGTGMPPWPQLQGEDLDPVVQYLKTFSPRWQTEGSKPGEKSDKHGMNVLPAHGDAASFRAASSAIPAEGSGIAQEASTHHRSVDAVGMPLLPTPHSR